MTWCCKSNNIPTVKFHFHLTFTVIIIYWQAVKFLLGLRLL